MGSNSNGNGLTNGNGLAALTGNVYAAEDPLIVFDPVSNVTDLFSFGAGTISTNEGGSFTISLRDTMGTFYDVLNAGFGGDIATVQLASFDADDFTDLGPITVDAVRIQFASDVGGATGTGFNFPAETVISFTTDISSVPLPASVVLLAGALAGVNQICDRYDLRVGYVR